MAKRVVRKAEKTKKVKRVSWAYWLGAQYKRLNLALLGKVGLVLLTGVIVFLIASRYRGLVLAGIVNKQPVWRMSLNQALVKRYGKAVVEELINNELVQQEAGKLKLTVSDAEIDEEVKQLAERIGGEQALKDALTQYGLSETELRGQMRITLLQRKIVEKITKVEVGDQEIKEYYEKNKSYYSGKKFDEVKEEIKEILMDQKAQEEYSKWFAEVKAKAQIEVYLDYLR